MLQLDKIGSEIMIKKIKPNNKIFETAEFQKDKYKFFLILQNLNSENVELYSDEENYVLCRGGVEYPTWIWTKDKIDVSLLEEIESAIELFLLDVDTRFTCKKELYDYLVKDSFEHLGEYYFEMGYLTCDKTIEPKKVDSGYSKYNRINNQYSNRYSNTKNMYSFKCLESYFKYLYCTNI